MLALFSVCLFGMPHARSCTGAVMVMVTVGGNWEGQISVSEKKRISDETHVEPSGVSAQKPFHARNQVRLGRFDHQVKMIGHEAIGMNLPSRLAARLAQGVDKPLAVGVVVEDRKGVPAFVECFNPVQVP